MEQRILKPDNDFEELDAYLGQLHVKTLLLVCGPSIEKLPGINNHLKGLGKKGIRVIRFSSFTPNPDYHSAVEGVEVFHKEQCDAVLAVGGGSAMDVAKCIKLFSSMNHKQNYLEQKIVPNSVPLIAMPTTAGTGSEATRFAVVYYGGVKQSVTDDSCIPAAVLMDDTVLEKLPLFQKKCTMLDALCHGIESLWSVNSTEESRKYSAIAIRKVLANMDGYLANTPEGNAGMLLAAHVAGKAINITQTTAGHAMCYKITGLYKTTAPHGYAAALCVRVLLPWMIQNTDKCVDPRGEEYLKCVLRQLANAMNCDTPQEASEMLDFYIRKLNLPLPEPTEEEIQILRDSVNPIRMKNHPILLDNETIEMLYRKTFGMPLHHQKKE